MKTRNRQSHQPSLREPCLPVMVKVNDRNLRHKDACHCDRKGGLLPSDELKSNIRIDLLSETGWQLRRFSSKLSWRLCSDSECQHSLLLCLEYQSTGSSAEMPPPNLARQNEHRRTFPALPPAHCLCRSGATTVIYSTFTFVV